MTNQKAQKYINKIRELEKRVARLEQEPTQSSIIDWNNCHTSEQLKSISTTKNDLGVDCIARQDVERYIEGFINEYTPKEELEFINLELEGLKHLPSVTPQEPINSVLEDIKAKLNEFKSHYMPSSGVEWGIKMCLEIIDKYKAESEET